VLEERLVLQTLIEFRFDTPLAQAIFYALGVLIIAYGAWAGWRNAPGTVDPKTKREQAPTREQRIQRALLYAVVFGLVVRAGFYYALPAGVFLGHKGDGFPLHTYGLLLMTGFLCAVAVAARLAERDWGGGSEGIKRRNQVIDLSVWVLVGSIGGAKLLYIVVNWQQYSGNWGSLFQDFPSKFLGLLGGGLVFYGGLICATAAVWWFCRKNALPFLRLADIIAPTVALGQAFGRLGCFSAGCCWGRPASEHVHWAVRFPGEGLARDLFGRPSHSAALAYSSQVQDAERWVIESTGQVFHHAVPGAIRVSDWVAQHGTTLPIHPTQLYEALAQLLLFCGLMIARRYKRFHGQIFGLYLVSYAIIRTTVELFRGDVERGTLNGLLRTLGAEGLAALVPLEAWWNIPTSQFISVVMFGLGVVLLVRRSAQVQPLPAPPGAQLA
jgi:phosphatidylglycerol---prolipoprotein diacylglyceryl transferase